MFNVSALLLDDALLKCNVTEVVLFSVVATHLRCGRIFSDSTITNILQTLTVKKCLKIDQYLMKLKGVQKCANFLGHTVHLPSQYTGTCCIA